MNHSQKDLKRAARGKLNLVLLFHILCSLFRFHASHVSPSSCISSSPPASHLHPSKSYPFIQLSSWFPPEADPGMKMSVWVVTPKSHRKEMEKETEKELEPCRVLCGARYCCGQLTSICLGFWWARGLGCSLSHSFQSVLKDPADGSCQGNMG